MDEAANRINGMTTQEYKIYENRLRRVAARQGLQLCKSRARDPRSVIYGGYHLANRQQMIVAGYTFRGFELSLDEVERFLLDEERDLSRRNEDASAGFYQLQRADPVV